MAHISGFECSQFLLLSEGANLLGQYDPFRIFEEALRSIGARNLNPVEKRRAVDAKDAGRLVRPS